jgi:hypothetical protein
MESPRGMRGELDDLLKAHPFTRFVIIMASGDRYTIFNPALTAMDTDTLMIANFMQPGRTILRLNQIGSLEIQEAAD